MDLKPNKPLDAALINDAVALLPKEHFWGSVHLEMGTHVDLMGNPMRLPLGEATCIKCGKTVTFTPSQGWLESVKLS